MVRRRSQRLRVWQRQARAVARQLMWKRTLIQRWRAAEQTGVRPRLAISQRSAFWSQYRRNRLRPDRRRHGISVGNEACVSRARQRRRLAGAEADPVRRHAGVADRPSCSEDRAASTKRRRTGGRRRTGRSGDRGPSDQRRLAGGSAGRTVRTTQTSARSLRHVMTWPASAREVRAHARNRQAAGELEVGSPSVELIFTWPPWPALVNRVLPGVGGTLFPRPLLERSVARRCPPVSRRSPLTVRLNASAIGSFAGGAAPPNDAGPRRDSARSSTSSRCRSSACWDIAHATRSSTPAACVRG